MKVRVRWAWAILLFVVDKVTWRYPKVKASTEWLHAFSIFLKNHEKNLYNLFCSPFNRRL